MMSFILSSWKQWSAHSRKSDSLGFSILRHGYRILDSLSVEHGFQIPVINGIQSTLGPLFQIPREKFPRFQTWGDGDPKINTFSVKLKPVNWASNYCRLSVHVVLVTAWCSCHYMLEKGGLWTRWNSGWYCTIPKPAGYDYETAIIQF